MNAIIAMMNGLVQAWNKLEFGVTVPFGGPSFSVGTPNLPEIPSFARGGIVPGRIGEPHLVLAHAGETILPTHRTGYQGGGDIYISVTVPVEGTLVHESRVEDFVHQAVLRGLERGLRFQT